MDFTVDYMPSLSGQAPSYKPDDGEIGRGCHPTRFETLWRPEPRRQYTGPKM